MKNYSVDFISKDTGLHYTNMIVQAENEEEAYEAVWDRYPYAMHLSYPAELKSL